MEINNILGASLIDIIFEGRNKNYGAYELRKKYNSRLYSAIAGTIAFVSLIVFASFISSGFDKQALASVITIDSVSLIDLPKEDPVIEPPRPVVQKPVQPPQIEMAKLATPKVVKDDLVKPEDEMKNIEDLTNKKISTVNKPGENGPDIVDPPIDEPKTGVITGPKEDEDPPIFLTVQIQAKFPGGDEAWRKYISREIERYMDELQEEGKAGSCTVQFVVDKDGTISEVEALTMKGSKLAEIAVNAIRKGPKWSPAENNGKKVKAYRKQPVTFQLLQ